jgi:4-hydroxybenzoate polyprenyltransferase
LARVVIACALFCVASSGIYLINDIRDRSADALHPIKRLRPIASGKIKVVPAAIGAVILLASGLLGSYALSPAFALIVGGYIALQIAYTLWLKHVALVDVFIIAIGFVLRAVSGGVVVNVAVSPWLLLCAFLLALFLALCKRRHEKRLLDESEALHRPSLGDYDQKLVDQLIAIVSAATITSYSIYTLWPDTVRKFHTSLLSLTIPLVMFGIFRYLDLVYRKEGGGRPEKTLLSDGPLMVDLALYGLTVLGIFAFSQ